MREHSFLVAWGAVRLYHRLPVVLVDASHQLGEEPGDGIRRVLEDSSNALE